MTRNERLKEARIALNMSQKDFARGICASPSFLASVENNIRIANDRLIRLISMTYGISESWIQDGKGEMFYKSPDEKFRRMTSLFNALPPNFQDFVLLQVEQLLSTTKNTTNSQSNSVLE